MFSTKNSPSIKERPKDPRRMMQDRSLSNKIKDQSKKHTKILDVEQINHRKLQNRVEASSYNNSRISTDIKKTRSKEGPIHNLPAKNSNSTKKPIISLGDNATSSIQQQNQRLKIKEISKNLTNKFFKNTQIRKTTIQLDSNNQSSNQNNHNNLLHKSSSQNNLSRIQNNNNENVSHNNNLNKVQNKNENTTVLHMSNSNENNSTLSSVSSANSSSDLRIKYSSNQLKSLNYTNLQNNSSLHKIKLSSKSNPNLLKTSNNLTKIQQHCNIQRELIQHQHSNKHPNNHNKNTLQNTLSNPTSSSNIKRSNSLNQIANSHKNHQSQTNSSSNLSTFQKLKKQFQKNNTLPHIKRSNTSSVSVERHNSNKNSSTQSFLNSKRLKQNHSSTTTLNNNQKNTRNLQTSNTTICTTTVTTTTTTQINAQHASNHHSSPVQHRINHTSSRLHPFFDNNHNIRKSLIQSNFKRSFSENKPVNIKNFEKQTSNQNNQNHHHQNHHQHSRHNTQSKNEQIQRYSPQNFQHKLLKIKSMDFTSPLRKSNFESPEKQPHTPEIDSVFDTSKSLSDTESSSEFESDHEHDLGHNVNEFSSNNFPNNFLKLSNKLSPTPQTQSGRLNSKSEDSNHDSYNSKIELPPSKHDSEMSTEYEASTPLSSNHTADNLSNISNSRNCNTSSTAMTSLSMMTKPSLKKSDSMMSFSSINSNHSNLSLTSTNSFKKCSKLISALPDYKPKFKCGKCQFRFASSLQLYRHIKFGCVVLSNQEIKNLECENCDHARFQNLIKLALHKKICPRKSQKNLCQKDSKYRKSAPNLNAASSKLNHDFGQNQIRLINANPSINQVPMSFNSSHKINCCILCNKITFRHSLFLKSSNNFELACSLLDLHQEIIDLECSFCGQQFENLEQLKYHVINTDKSSCLPGWKESIQYFDDLGSSMILESDGNEG